MSQRLRLPGVVIVAGCHRDSIAVRIDTTAGGNARNVDGLAILAHSVAAIVRSRIERTEIQDVGIRLCKLSCILFSIVNASHNLVLLFCD